MITTIDKAACTTLRGEVMDAINATLGGYGLVAKIDGIVRFTPGVQMRCSLEFVAVGAGQSADEALSVIRRDDWCANAPQLGMPADAFGKVITVGGNQYRIDGFVGKSSEKVSLVQLRSGVRKQCGPQVIITAVKLGTLKVAA